MALATATYYYLTCNGRLNNLVQPKCPAMSDGALGSEEEARSNAAAAGWLLGPKDYCPACARNHTPTPDAAAEPKRPRRRKTEDPAPITGDAHVPDSSEQFA